MTEQDRLYIRIKYSMPARFEFGRFDKYARWARINLPEDFIVLHFGLVLKPNWLTHHYDSAEFPDLLTAALLEYEDGLSDKS